MVVASSSAALRRAPKARIYAFADSVPFAKRLARRLGVGVSVVVVHGFPDGESLVRVPPLIGQRATLVRSLHDPNSKLWETLLAADALRRAGAKRLTLVAPYLPYMRQDMVFHRGEPLSQQVLGKLLTAAFDRVLTVEAHLHRIQRLSDVMPGRSLSAVDELVTWIRRHAAECCVVGPDSESAPRIRAIAKRAGVPFVVGEKKRSADRRVRITFPAVDGCRRAVVVDDIASSGATLAEAARALRDRGVRQVDAVVVHAVFSSGALQRIRRAGVSRVVSCDTIPHSTNAIWCAPVVAAALQEGRRWLDQKASGRRLPTCRCCMSSERQKR